jgi:hypothetical protein
MRKRFSYFTLFFLGIVIATSFGGCRAVATSLCDDACDDYNALKCGTTCDCSACGEAPPECDSYYNCIKTYSGTCVELTVTCPVPTACEQFIHNNCN